MLNKYHSIFIHIILNFAHLYQAGLDFKLFEKLRFAAVKKITLFSVKAIVSTLEVCLC